MPEKMLQHTKVYLKSLLSYFDLSNIDSVIKSWAIIILSLLAPIKSAILAVYFLIFTDFITGVWASIKEKQTITSSKMSRSISKVLIYSITIVVSFIVHKYLLVDFDLPIEAIVSGFIAITETKSILENLNRISSHRVIKDLILFLSNEREKRMPAKPTRRDSENK
ncbi:MAG: phage holin family protein [Bacteroidota bacterium]